MLNLKDANAGNMNSTESELKKFLKKMYVIYLYLPWLTDSP